MSIHPLIVIPSRLGGTRLPDKPLKLINGVSLIRLAWESAVAADIGPVIVACDSPAIAQKIPGGAILTRKDHVSGTDRVWEAVQLYDPDGKYHMIVNLQGDIPFVEYCHITPALNLLNTVEMGTVCTTLHGDEINDPNVVKAFVEPPGSSHSAKLGRVVRFSRHAWRSLASDYYRHIGIYAFRRSALERFASLRPSEAERHQRLEQFRATENNISIDLAHIPSGPIEINIPDDLIKANNGS